jgi:hypothetical protein
LLVASRRAASHVSVATVARTRLAPVDVSTPNPSPAADAMARPRRETSARAAPDRRILRNPAVLKTSFVTLPPTSTGLAFPVDEQDQDVVQGSGWGAVPGGFAVHGIPPPLPLHRVRGVHLGSWRGEP